jgi:hypothetical protein
MAASVNGMVLGFTGICSAANRARQFMAPTMRQIPCTDSIANTGSCVPIEARRRLAFANNSSPLVPLWLAGSVMSLCGGLQWANICAFRTCMTDMSDQSTS